MSRIKVDRITDKAGTGAPILVNGMNVTGKSTMGDIVGAAVTFNSVNSTAITGNVTGNLTGDVTGSGANLTNLPAGQLTGALPAISGANLTGIDAAPSVSGIASASIASGAPVMMNEDGKLSAITGTAGLRSTTCPFVTTQAASSPEQADIVYDTANDKFIAVYHGGGTGANEIHAKIGTVNGSTGVITWGSEQQLTPGGSENPSLPNALWDTVNNRLLTLYRDAANSNKGYMIVSSISGGTITSGTPVAVTSAAINRYCMVQDPVEDKIIVFYENSSNVGKAIVGEITAASNTSSWTGEATYCSNRAFTPVAAFYPGQNKIVCSFQHYSSSEKGAVVAGTVSGNSITFGSIQYYETNYRVNGSLSYDSTNGQMLLAWQSGTSPYNSKMRTATLSGTTFTFGTLVVIKGVTNTSGSDGDPSIVFDPNSKKALLVFTDSTAGTSKLSSSIVTTSGSAPTDLNQNAAQMITNNNETASLYSGQAGKILSLDTDNNLMAYIFVDSNSSQRGLRYYTERIGSSNMNSTNFVGLSQAAYTNGQTAKIDVVGSTNTNQTGLTTATKYFVQGNGTLGTTADDPSVAAGLALSDTSLLIRGN